MRRFFQFIILSGIIFSSCGQGSEGSGIKLPPTPVLENRDSWAVNLTKYVAVRQAPDTESEMLTQLARGQVLRIIERTLEKEKIGDKTDYWYKVEDGKSRGWIFGSHLVIFPSHEEAAQYKPE
ncbi:MAG: SH3 domain-containing protein [Spirochaetaceae bacterium]|nr:MAG: SH3 domain-containing protein [Spirochaetaceae bacterium]